MKNNLTLLLLLFLALNIHSQNNSDGVSESIVNELMIFEIDNRPKHNDDKKLGKKRIYVNPIAWNQVMIKLISTPPYNFEFQKSELINRDKRYNRELKSITELFTESDFAFMEKQFNSEQKTKWNFITEKGKIINSPKKNYYSYSTPLFNKKCNTAIVYAEFGGCGNLCGEGNIIVYLKKNNNWEYYKTIPLWIS